MADAANNNGNSSAPNGSTNSSKVAYLFAAKGSKKRPERKDENDIDESNGLEGGRFRKWLTVTAYVLIGLTVLYTGLALIASLRK